MRVDTIALKNLKRRPIKALFMLLGIILAVGTIVTLYTSTATLNVELADRFDEIGANIMVIPDSKDMNLSYGGVRVSGAQGKQFLANDDIISINTIPNSNNIATVAPKLLTSLTIQGEKAVVMGVDFPQELALKPWWTMEGERPKGVQDVLLGSDAAIILGIKPGDVIEIEGEIFNAAAVLHPQGSEEDGLIFMQLLAVQRLADLEDSLSLIEVAAYCTTCPIEEIVMDINNALPHAKATALGEAVKARAEVVDRFNKFSAAVAFVVFSIGSLLILVTVISSVKERTKEIGIFRAIGFRQRSIIEIFLTEALILGMFGGILGYIAGNLAARALISSAAGLDVAIGWDFFIGGITIVMALVLSLLSSAYPAVKAARLDPAEALRHI
ncbi:MAG: ABC transporter permease [Clostridia bacterium]|nr:ABC transporter permease [Clostridia bacterium]